MSKKLSEVMAILRKSDFSQNEIHWATPELNPSLTGITQDSRRVRPGDIFVAIRGNSMDGHDYLSQALESGAVAVLVDSAMISALDLESFAGKISILTSTDTLESMASLASAVYGQPQNRVDVYGITGTNGKTTTTYLLESILGQSAVFGTINCRIGDIELDGGGNTTPLSADLFRNLNQAYLRGCRNVIMEVSSHALELHRVRGIEFKTAIFTNLTPEHLDFHRDMDDYFKAKKRLFEMVRSDGYSVVSVACEYGKRLFSELATRGRRVLASGPGARELSLNRPHTGWVEPLSWEMSRTGIIGIMGWSVPDFHEGSCNFSSPLTGEFNMLNISGAWAAALSAGICGEEIAGGIAAMNRVPGRFDTIQGPGFTVIVDYAHTGDSLANVLRCLADLRSRESGDATGGNGRIITVFGCGGDRDRTKRSVMGKIASTLSDHVIVTSDNPRTENPDAIISEILQGIDPGFSAEIIPDRAAAIDHAITIAGVGDYILIAGKGHEDYQITGAGKIHFDDGEEVAGALRRARARRGEDV
ncbi:MAG: UDP-N-acetylmuramoyl-L-alanyl-D-glutamate--2,6-diaminopimelate ligase [Candidatus Wallbacteria bacterium HGW-Wallbacteria-1]|jgi:UDP-N-acetylmuramoyl-L-alanyl-D-glutamate--2,6-diaminopimelate ligase|uniref:UDP-N-acetylmuramoyl-L-alanyl-D-glutamate--2,6-diaminopimelate ligase n=1 Tax=Candidatus Wallbacteria bacterium HGW-Wallbacteria-1 TaxID=2013854 RepID=A0A2N1PQC7_9BACT|nr:MAG: UDP-N-acetylmuramoyl-L-alanyl-D-glutamate--2,6-diaminopimelate ligase [Candidatus Wallbacteria bacterium HGW-Wallbacteria-1]